MRIAVFGGSFDPVHIEHTRIAAAAIEELRLDKLVVMPAHMPPHKPGKILSPDFNRLEMCRLAFSEQPNVEISDYEMTRGGTSYTYLTCQYFREKYPNADIFWLVGTDMLRDFPTWKNTSEILDCVTLAVCGRAEKENWLEKERADFYARFQKEFAFVSYNGADVSSTEIRVLAGAGMPLTPFVESNVEKYIQEKGLYYIPNADRALNLEKPHRKAHSIRVANLAAARAVSLRMNEKQAIEAALFHDCAKNLEADSPYLKEFCAPSKWGKVPVSVVHQFAGAYVAETFLGVKDADVLNAIRFHTSARPNMSELEKLIFLSDMLESERSYEGVDELRTLFWDKNGLDVCLTESLRQTLLFLKEKGGDIYPLTQAAYDFYKINVKKEKKYGGSNK